MKTFITLSLALLCTTLVWSQNGERIKAVKRAHITDALNLTTTEAEKFWPVYNAHEDKMEALKKKRRSEFMRIIRGDMEGVTDAEANQLIDKSIAFNEQEMQLNKAFVTELRNVLPPKKILRLHRAEEEFKRMLIEKMKNRKNRRGQN